MSLTTPTRAAKDDGEPVDAGIPQGVHCPWLFNPDANSNNRVARAVSPCSLLGRQVLRCPSVWSLAGPFRCRLALLVQRASNRRIFWAG
jgi:hypothetical protein